jgi:hypothetical protein
MRERVKRERERQKEGDNSEKETFSKKARQKRERL